MVLRDGSLVSELKVCQGKTAVSVNPFRTAVPFRGQTIQILSSLSPNRDCAPKKGQGVKVPSPDIFARRRLIAAESSTIALVAIEGSEGVHTANCLRTSKGGGGGGKATHPFSQALGSTPQ